MRVLPNLFSVRRGDSNGAAHLLLKGRFDASSLLAFDDAISDVVHRDVILDLDGLTFMDGAAWLAVMRCEDRVHSWGRNLRLVNVPGRIRKIFEVTETEHLLSEVVTG